MNSPAYDIIDILDLIGESSAFDDLIFNTNLFVGREPANPINCVTIYDTPGGPPDLCLDSVGYERPSIHIRVRNVKQMNGYAIAERLKDSLHGLAQTTINGTLYSVIKCSGSPTLLELNDNGQSIHIINFDLQRRTA